MSLVNLPTVNFSQGRDLITIALSANQTVLLIGDPGVGKSAIVYEAARKLGMPLYVLLGSTLDPTDIGGLPVRAPDSTHVERIPLTEIQRCAAAPGILFLDEISSAPGPVQAALLRLILERVAGSVTMHPGTRIIAACNPPEQTPSGIELTPPLVGRMSIVRFQPEVDEVLAYFRSLGDVGPEATDMDRAIGDEALAYAATASVSADLLQIDMPKECLAGGTPWASPRSVERMIRAIAAARMSGVDVDGQATFAAMSGSVGVRVATAYQGILRMVKDLPTVDQIVADPHKAPCPEDRAKQIAALSLMPRIGRANLWAGYIYAARLRPEFGVAAHAQLISLTRYQPNLTDPLTQSGIKARGKISALVAPTRAGGSKDSGN